MTSFNVFPFFFLLFNLKNLQSVDNSIFAAKNNSHFLSFMSRSRWKLVRLNTRDIVTYWASFCEGLLLCVARLFDKLLHCNAPCMFCWNEIKSQKVTKLLDGFGCFSDVGSFPLSLLADPLLECCEVRWLILNMECPKI